MKLPGSFLYSASLAWIGASLPLGLSSTTTNATWSLHTGPTADIINGNKASVGEFPSFAYGELQACAATLVFPDVLVTAAHCLDAFEEGSVVHIGGTKQDGSNALESIPVDWALPYPKYSDFDLTARYDIMLVFLQYRSNRAKPSKWNVISSVPVVDANLTILGHGETESSFDSYDLLKATLKVVDPNVCADAYEQPFPIFVEEQICMSSRPQSACYGDSGGPLLDANGVLIGITTGGAFDCVDPDIPNRYTRVSTYKDWILENICEYSKYRPTTGECDKYDPPKPCNKPKEQCKFLGMIPGKLLHRNFLGICTERCQLRQSPNVLLNWGWQCGTCDSVVEIPDDNDVVTFDDDFFN